MDSTCNVSSAAISSRRRISFVILENTDCRTIHMLFLYVDGSNSGSQIICTFSRINTTWQRNIKLSLNSYKKDNKQNGIGLCFLLKIHKTKYTNLVYAKLCWFKLLHVMSILKAISTIYGLSKRETMFTMSEESRLLAHKVKSKEIYGIVQS